MPDNPHDLQLTILPRISHKVTSEYVCQTFLESLVQQDPLDGGVLTAGRELRLEDNTKGAIANNLALRILDFSGFSSQSILDLLANDFCRALSAHVLGIGWARAACDACG